VIEGNDTTINSITVVDTIRTPVIDTNIANKLISYTYQTKTAKSSMVPGRIEVQDPAEPLQVYAYRVFFAADYNPRDGQPLVEDSRPA